MYAGIVVLRHENRFKQSNILIYGVLSMWIRLENWQVRVVSIYPRKPNHMSGLENL